MSINGIEERPNVTTVTATSSDTSEQTVKENGDTVVANGVDESTVSTNLKEKQNDLDNVVDSATTTTTTTTSNIVVLDSNTESTALKRVS